MKRKINKKLAVFKNVKVEKFCQQKYYTVYNTLRKKNNITF